MIGIFLFLFFLIYFIFSIKETGKISLAFLAICLISIFFNRSINILGVKYVSFFNYVCLIYVILAFIRNKTSELCRKSVIFFSTYLISLVIWSILNDTLFSEGMMIGFRRVLAWFCLALYGCLTLKHREDFNKIVHAVTPFLFFLTIYGLFCYITQSNPILNSIFSYTGVDDKMLSYFSQESRGGLTGRIQGLTSHPLVYAGEMLMSFFFCMYSINIGDKINVKLVVLLILIVLNIFFTGCRSAIIGLGFGLLLYFLLPTTNDYFRKKFQKAIIILVSIALVYTPFIEEYRDFLNSIVFFWQESEKTVSGSSFLLRIGQLYSSFEIISSNSNSLLFGLGHNWCNMYALSHDGMHPDLYGFESIVFVGLIEFGIIGFFFLTLGLYFLYLELSLKFGKSSVITAVVFGYLTFQVFTGDYSSDHFLIFTLLMIKNQYLLSYKKLHT